MDLQDFGVHKVLICTMSPFFNAAFNSGFEEAKTGIMKLEHTDSKVFEVFYTWLYTKTLCCDDAKISWTQKYNTLLQLCVFGDMAQIPALKNALIRALYVLIQEADSLGVKYASFRGYLKYVWENTTALSPLRRFVVDLCVWKLNINFFVERKAHDFTVPMCLEIMRAMEAKWLKGHSPSASPLDKLDNYDEPVAGCEALMKTVTWDAALF